MQLSLPLRPCTHRRSNVTHEIVQTPCASIVAPILTCHSLLPPGGEKFATLCTDRLQMVALFTGNACGAASTAISAQLTMVTPPPPPHTHTHAAVAHHLPPPSHTHTKRARATERQPDLNCRTELPSRPCRSAALNTRRPSTSLQHLFQPQPLCRTGPSRLVWCGGQPIRASASGSSLLRSSSLLPG